MNERRELADRIDRSVSYFAGEITGIYLAEGYAKYPMESVIAPEPLIAKDAK